MKETVAFCDHCGTILGKDDFEDTIIERDDDIFFRADLCCKCSDKLNSIIREFLGRGA